MAEVTITMLHRHLQIVDDFVEAHDDFPLMPIFHVRCRCGLRQTWPNRLDAETAMLIHRLEFVDNQQHTAIVRNGT